MVKELTSLLKVPVGWLIDARTRIARAEAELGPLSDGQRRDLLKDNKPWGRLTIAAIVEKLASERKAPFWRITYGETMPVWSSDILTWDEAKAYVDLRLECGDIVFKIELVSC